MFAALLFFSLGLIVVPWLPQLPEISDLKLLILGVLPCMFRPKCFPVLGLLLGFAYGVYSGQSWLAAKIPYELEGQVLETSVRVESVAAKRQFLRFNATGLSGQLEGKHLQLLWLSNEPLAAGEVWRVRLKVFRPRGTVNLGLYDYESWLLQQRINGVGYVLPQFKAEKLRQPIGSYWLTQTRHELSQKLRAQLLPQDVQGALLALIFGDSSQLSAHTWHALSATGTNHLFVVSGLHVGLVAAVLFFVCRILGLRRKVAMPLVGLVLLGYGQLVGLGLPVQRALIMVVCAMLAVSINRYILGWRILGWALFVVLLLNPFAPLSAGFWLSFGAVAGLIAAFSGWQSGQSPFWYLSIQTQWVALLVTAPLLLSWIGQVSAVSVLANSILIPLVGLLVVPLVLLYLSASLLGLGWLEDQMLGPLAIAIELVLALLEFFAEQSWVIDKPIQLEILFLLLAASTMMLLPKGVTPRWMLLCCWLPVLTNKADVPGEGFLRVEVMDVGQGLSVLIAGPESTLVYDAGPSFSKGDAGLQVVAPRLRRLGRKQIDLLVTSHGDDDHAGGIESIKSNMPVQLAISSDRRFGTGCEASRQRLKDFEVSLMMASVDTSSRNNSSCVVFIESVYGKILLPGDIEAAAEKALLPLIKQADLLISAHHGSLSSSVPAFINRVSPKWVVHSSGHLNRFNHPHPEVWARFSRRGVRQFNTASSGAVIFEFTADGVVIESARERNPRFWYDAARPETAL